MFQQQQAPIPSQSIHWKAHMHDVGGCHLVKYVSVGDPAMLTIGWISTSLNYNSESSSATRSMGLPIIFFSTSILSNLCFLQYLLKSQYSIRCPNILYKHINSSWTAAQACYLILVLRLSSVVQSLHWPPSAPLFPPHNWAFPSLLSDKDCNDPS